MINILLRILGMSIGFIALQLNNDIRGLDAREAYIESLIAKLDNPGIIVLPELSQPGYMCSTEKFFKHVLKSWLRVE